MPIGNTLSKVKPSFSGPETACELRIMAVWRLSSNDTTISPPSLSSRALGGRNLCVMRQHDGCKYTVDLGCWWAETYRQTTLMLVEDAMMDDPSKSLVRCYDQCTGIWIMFGIRRRTVVGDSKRCRGERTARSSCLFPAVAEHDITRHTLDYDKSESSLQIISIQTGNADHVQKRKILNCGHCCTIAKLGVCDS